MVRYFAAILQFTNPVFFHINVTFTEFFILQSIVNIDKIKKQNAHYRTQGTQAGAELYNSKMDNFLQENQKIINNIEKFKAKYQAQSKANTR